jgi:hypothetical protein
VADDRFLAELAELNWQYVAALPERRTALNAAWARFHGGELAALDPFYREVHYLTGTGATFGQPAISDAAGVLEARLIAVRGRAPAGEEMAEIARLRDALDAAFPGS